MDAVSGQLSSLLETKEPLSDEQFNELVKQIRGGASTREQFAEKFTAVIEQRGSELAGDGVLAMKVAEGFYALGDYQAALEWLGKPPSGKGQSYLKARCLVALRQYDQALAELEQAGAKGWDSFEIAMKTVDCLRRAGKLTEAEEHLKRVSRVGEIRAEYHFQLGRLQEANGLHERAMEEYERVITLDSRHTEALFYLAYACDLYGDEQIAMEYYERCLQTGPTHVNALMNLAVLYEDREQYENALRCVKRVLAAYPNHARARMFLKDIESSMIMHIDEEQERKIDQQNQVLQIPISDFELSVRSRNCLKKMNIRYIGDLLRVSEAELLAYKNFGETSLQEIKSILGQKSLRLGQLIEDRNNGLRLGAAPDESEQEQDNELLSMPVAELQLSVRARKCLQKLNINIVSDLVKCTEAELLGCKNFGQTSLLEIQQKLKEHNLALRTLDE